MDNALGLSIYLPMSYQSPKDEEYIRFLWDAFETNYTHGRYQFAFLAYHMLVMSFIYFEIWQIKQNRRQDFEKAMIGFNKDIEKELMNASSPFTLWRVNESTVVRFLKLIGCDNEKVGNYISLVKERNNSAHSNGNIYLSTQEALDLKISGMLRIVAEIQDHSLCVIEECYREFLVQNLDAEEWQYTDPTDQVREVLVYPNYLSQRDMEICLAFDAAALAQVPEHAAVLELHEALAELIV